MPQAEITDPLPSVDQRTPLVLWAVLAALSLGLLTFSLTVAPVWNEGFHLVAAQLINAGKKPYLDFFYQHPPFYLYVNAAWMRLVGETWRSADALATLLTVASLVLVAQFMFSRLPAPSWRLAGAITAALLVGLHVLVIRLGTVGQPYGLCLFLTVLGFRLVIAAVDQAAGFLPACAGLCSGAAAASLLFAAPAGPVLLFWMLRHNRAGSRRNKCFQFLAGTAVGLLPLVWLAAQGHRQVLFDVVGYHLFYRRPDAWSYLQHDLKVLTGWLDSARALLMVLLAGLGLMFLTQPGEWLARRQKELYLCLWLALGLAVLPAVANPTFSGYFLLLIPFLSMLAAVGFYAIGIRFWAPRRPMWLVLAVAGFLVLGTAKWFFQQRSMFQFRWQNYERIANEVNRVTPKEDLLYASPEIYFAARRLPPPGLENPFSSSLPPTAAGLLHFATTSEVEGWLAEGRFATVVLADNGSRAEALGLSRLYAKHKRLDGFDLFWDKIAARSGRQ